MSWPKAIWFMGVGCWLNWGILSVWDHYLYAIVPIVGIVLSLSCLLYMVETLEGR